MGEAWWQVTARGTNLARNERERGGLTVELGVLPEEWARRVPDEPQELCMDDLGDQEAEGGLVGPKPVCRPRCLPAARSGREGTGKCRSAVPRSATVRVPSAGCGTSGSNQAAGALVAVAAMARRAMLRIHPTRCRYRASRPGLFPTVEGELQGSNTLRRAPPAASSSPIPVGRSPGCWPARRAPG